MKERNYTVVDVVNYTRSRMTSGHNVYQDGCTHELYLYPELAEQEDPMICTKQQFDDCVKNMAEAKWLSKDGLAFNYSQYKKKWYAQDTKLKASSFIEITTSNRDMGHFLSEAIKSGTVVSLGNKKFKAADSRVNTVDGSIQHSISLSEIKKTQKEIIADIQATIKSITPCDITNTLSKQVSELIKATEVI